MCRLVVTERGTAGPSGPFDNRIFDERLEASLVLAADLALSPLRHPEAFALHRWGLG